MEEFLKKETIINLITSIVFLIVGIILYINPVTTISVMTYFIEALLIITGIITIVNYIKVDVKHDVFSLGFVHGVVCILISLFLIVNPKIIATILPIVIGIWMVFGSLTRIQIAIKLSSWGSKTSIWNIVFAVIMFLLGIVFICNPYATSAILVKMLGIGIVIYAVIDMIEEISILSFIAKLNK